MRVWRLTKPEHAPGLDGEGARLWGGRWNSPGVAVVYTASSLALAALEYLVHLPPHMRRPGKLPLLSAVAINIPDAIVLQTLEDESSAPQLELDQSRAVGNGWVLAGGSLGFIVPSKVIAQELNIILNPAHPDMQQVTVVSIGDFCFDDRLAT